MVILSILLTILKWIGIILLCIIALILLLALLILFVPIRYNILANCKDKNLKAIIKVHWQAHIFRFKLKFDMQRKLFNYYFKIGPVVIFSSKKSLNNEQVDNPDRKSLLNIKFLHKDTKSDKNEITNKNEIEKDLVNNIEDETQTFEFSEKNNNNLIDNVNCDYEKIDSEIENDYKKSNHETLNENEKSDQEIDKEDNKYNIYSILGNIVNKTRILFLKIPHKLNSIREFVTNKKYTITRVYDIIKTKYRIFIKYKDFINDNVSRKALRFLKQEFKILLKHFGPRKFDLNISYGFEDISLTGEMLAIISILYPSFPGKLNVHADFENKCFEADTYIKGHIRLIIVLIHAIKILKNEEVMQSYKKFKSIKK